MTFTEILKPLQLEQTEEKAFMLLTQYGALAASIVAKKMEIKRTTCYLVLERLVQKGIVERTIRKGIRTYQAVTLDTLEKVMTKHILIFEEAKQKLQKNKQELQLLYRSNEENTEVIFYEGYDEIKKAYEKVLFAEDKEIYSLTKKERTEDHLMHDFWKSYLKRRIKMGKKTYSFVNAEEASKIYTSESKKENREVKTLQAKDIELFGDFKVSGSVVAFMSQHHGRIWGFTIDDVHVAKFFKSMMKLLWKKIP